VEAARGVDGTRREAGPQVQQEVRHDGLHPLQRQPRPRQAGAQPDSGRKRHVLRRFAQADSAAQARLLHLHPVERLRRERLHRTGVGFRRLQRRPLPLLPHRGGGAGEEIPAGATAAARRDRPLHQAQTLRRQQTGRPRAGLRPP